MAKNPDAIRSFASLRMTFCAQDDVNSQDDVNLDSYDKIY